MKTGTISHLRPELTTETKPSVYDNIVAAVVAGILLSGFLFCALFAIWLTTEFDFSRRTVEPTSPKLLVTPPKGDDKDIVEPGVQEFPEVATPQLAATLLKVTDVVSAIKASPEQFSGEHKQVGKGIRSGHREDDDAVGPIGTPAYKRWTIAYQAENLETYADQLSFFNIDLGVIHMTRNDIWRIQDPGGATKVINSNRAKENKTLRFQQAKQRMRLWDHQICKQAGVETDNTVLCQFYPNATQSQILKVEAAAVAADGRELKEVKKTSFKIVPKDSGFEFEVVEIIYH